MLCYFKHLNLCHRTEENQLKRKVDHTWNILDPYPCVEDRALNCETQKNQERSMVVTSHA